METQIIVFLLVDRGP